MPESAVRDGEAEVRRHGSSESGWLSRGGDSGAVAPAMRCRAFSFVEIMIGVVMGLFVMVSMAEIFQSSQRMFHKTEQALEAFQGAVLATKVLEQDLGGLVLPLADERGRFAEVPPGVLLPENGTEEMLLRPFVWDPGAGRAPVRLAHPDGKEGPIKLSACTRPFVFFRVEPVGGTYRVQKISYSLERKSVNGLDWFHLVRVSQIEGESEETTRYTMRLKDVILDLRFEPWDPKAPKEDIEAGMGSYYLHLWVCGVSSNVDSRRKEGKGGKDFFPHVCLRTLALEVLNERFSPRRGGAFWRNVRAEEGYLTGEGVLTK